MRTFAAGQAWTHERSFTHEDVLDFLRISGDSGRHHAEPYKLVPGRRWPSESAKRLDAFAAYNLVGA